MESMFPNLTRAWCDCCDEILVDPVALTAVCDAVRAHRDALVEKRERDQDAWAEAGELSRAAVEAAGAGRG